MTLLFMALTACSETPSGAKEKGQDTPQSDSGSVKEPFADVRQLFGDNPRLTRKEYIPSDIATYWFNGDTVFEGSEEIAEQVIERGKNPGLGVRALHEEGITGKGVSVAIIDQVLLPDHPEYKDKLAGLWFHPNVEEGMKEEGSMHGPAVASLLVGETIGTAPGAKLYFAAVRDGENDSKCYADALNWILETNKALPSDEKIRVISISAAPSGEGSLFEGDYQLYDKAVAEAQAQGVLVLDCREDSKTGIIMPAFYDPGDPENVEKMRMGFTDRPFDEKVEGIGVPSGYRTTAEEYVKDKISYQYTGNGGLSWAIPYASGVLAMGWQMQPQLSGDEIIEILLRTAYEDKIGNKFINPQAFIDAVGKTVK